MRYLNKIVFINSASVSYSEIDLDGNIHFTGNQGSGKTTLLRAILFFYNANKLKLGIGREKRRFDDYYFEYQNSYIVYEVKRDETKYCILTYKINGKTAFRFIDSEYKKEYFISPQGQAYESWDKIRTALGKHIHYSKIVSNYEEYRQIIYGDNKGLRPEFRKYSIIESKQYQNIPRTIQNVFLNSKLEAQFIKETIINSISDEVFSIDLENYAKNHLRDFENQINDVKIWSQKNKRGQITIRRQADQAIENYRIYNFLKREKQQLTQQLYSRMQFIEREKPVLSKVFKDEQQKLNEIKNRIDNLEKLFRNREKDILSDIKVSKNKIEEAKRKLADYDAKNIYDIIEKVKQKAGLEQEKNRLEEEKKLLETKYSAIKEKFDSLIKQQENALERFFNKKDKEFNEVKDKITNSKIVATEKHNSQIESLKNEFQEQFDTIEEQLKELSDSENRQKQKRAELKHKMFFRQEIEELESKIKELEKDNYELKSQKQNFPNQIKTIRKEWELEETRTNRNFDIAFDEKRKEVENHQNVIKDVEQKIEQSKSSFYSWLNENVENWENTIGKVIDENLLYKQNIEPVLKNKDSGLFYGVDINLDIIEKKVKTVAELNTEIENIKSKIGVIQKEIYKLEEDKNTELKKLKTKFSKTLNNLKDNISENEYKLTQNENQLIKLSLSFKELKENSAAEKERELENIENELDKIAVNKQELEKKHEQTNNRLQRLIKRQESEKNKELANLQLQLENKEKELKQGKDTFQQQINTRIIELKKQQFSEMENRGADTQRIQTLELQLKDINGKLAFINENESLVIEYYKDKRELFDNVPEYKTNIKELERKLDELSEKNKKDNDKLSKKYADQNQKLDDLKRKIQDFENDIEKFAGFEKSEVFKTVEQFYTAGSETTSGQIKAASIIEDLMDKHYKLIDTLSEIRRTVNLFTGNFSENNIFKFKTKFDSDNEYIIFVSELKEFVEEDKISEFEKRVNERFANIVLLIARETNELMSKEAEIGKIIKKINNDFLKKNFVKAIKEMEIRTNDSTNPVVNILIRIKQFNDENSLFIGQNNLFTDSDLGDKNRKAVELLKQLIKELEKQKNPVLTLSDSFDLQFRIVENDNNTGWVENLSNVGSEGTDILVKAMINILLLNVFKESASRKFQDFKLHCMMDEIGRLHPVNVKGILRFANERNILLINGSPISQNATDYRYTYKLSKERSSANKKYITRVKRLIKFQ